MNFAKSTLPLETRKWSIILVCRLRLPDFSVYSGQGGGTFSEVKSQVIKKGTKEKFLTLFNPLAGIHPFIRIIC